MSDPFDTEIAIIGGGIHGAGIAQAAAAAGYRVSLFERDRWAAGTSQRSSKLIHGGLRYLETGQLPLVYHSLQERKFLLRNAPDLVKAVPFYIPVYRDSSRRPWQIFAGLSLYCLLSGGSKLGRFRRLSRQSWSKLPGLKTEGLQAVFQYWDGQTDDRLLTEAVVSTAQSLGAEPLSGWELVSAKRLDDGYQMELRNQAGEQRQGRCRCLINAAGPWINDCAHRIEGAPQLGIDLVRGSHIVLTPKLSTGILYLESPLDQRPLFVMPWGEHSLVGTTEQLHTTSADQVSASDEEIAYLLQAVEHYFPNTETTLLDAWAGLRVLPKADGSANKRPRDTILLCDDDRAPNVIAVYGGKLTAYRHTAERCIQLASRKLGGREAIADTRKQPLSKA